MCCPFFRKFQEPGFPGNTVPLLVIMHIHFVHLYIYIYLFFSKNDAYLWHAPKVRINGGGQKKKWSHTSI